eukprot:4927062-Ditylum_brightwellii.AAC.1
MNDSTTSSLTSSYWHAPCFNLCTEGQQQHVLIVFQNEKGNARGGVQARKGLMTGCFEDAKSFGFEEPYFFYFTFPN